MVDKRIIDVDSLVDFLQSHAPKVPKATSELEVRIFSAIKGDLNAGTKQPAPSHSSYMSIFAGAALVLLVIGMATAVITKRNNQELELDPLEQFTEESWNGALATDQDVEFQYLTAETDKSH